MRVCLVGGIFGKPPEYRESHSRTPETTLADGLRARGHGVTERGHGAPYDFAGFDVVHVHHLAAGAVAVAAAQRRPRFAFTAHAMAAGNLGRHAALRYVIARADAIVALSETEAHWQRAQFRGAQSRQHLIRNGIDESVYRFRQPSAPSAGEPWRLLYVGQLVPFKGVDVLLDAIASLGAGSPAVDLELVYQVATAEAALRRQAAEMGLTGVRFLGPRTPAELAEIYARSHVLVLPSTNEALPSVVLEAMFVGRPVVGTQVGAVAEQVGDFGRVVAPGDADALATAIADVIAGYDAYARASAAASRAALARYSIDAMVDAHERMYTQMVERPPASRGLTARAVDAAVGAALRLRAPRQ
jgi:glycosyltransferase involved in cell wall biosynthesis